MKPWRFNRLFAALFSVAAALAIAAGMVIAAAPPAAPSAPAATPAAPAAAPAAPPAPSAAEKPLWIGEGTPYATPYYVIESGKPGPTVLIVGGIHGNEPAGAGAAEEIRHWTIACGKLIVLPQANRPGLAAVTRAIPSTGPGAAAAGDEANLNRCFPSAPDESPKGPLAAAIWKMVERVRPDWLVDLHEGSGTAGEGDASVGSSIISSRPASAKERARSMLETVNATIGDEKKRFVLKSQPIAGSLARGAGDRLGAATMIAETTSKGQPRSLRERQHRIVVHRLLEDLKMAACGADVLAGPRGRQVRMALYDGPGTNPNPTLEAKFAADGDLAVHWVGEPEIAWPALGQFDVLVVPGGGGSAESRGLGAAGCDAIRRFVGDGGGYVGICAGAYLASAGYSWSLGIINAKVADGMRGKGMPQVELTDEGRRILGSKTGPFEIKYQNGPLIVPAGREGLPAYTVLARFRSEIVASGREPKIAMDGSPAIVCAAYRKGRVICLSPHPEGTPGLEGMARAAVRWAAGRTGP
jgi:putative intracellular protease/amidase